MTRTEGLEGKNMKADLTQIKKILTVCVHLFSLGMVIVSIYILYANANFGRGYTWLQSETYAQSELFYNQLQSDIRAIFDYARLQEAFETDGEVDPGKEVLIVSQGQNSKTSYTLEEIIQLGEHYGFLIQSDWSIEVLPVENTATKENVVLIDYKAYDPDPVLTEPGQAYAKMKDLCYEVLTNFTRYAYVYYNMIEGESNLSFELVCRSYNDEMGYDTFSYTNVSVPSWEKLKHMGLYAEVSSDSSFIETNMIKPPSYLLDLAEKTAFYEQSFEHFVISIDTNFPYHDIYNTESSNYAAMRKWTMRGMVFMGFGLLGSLFSFLYLMMLSGYQGKDRSQVVLLPVDRLSPEGCVLLFSMIGAVCVFFGRFVGFRLLHLITAQSSWYYTEKLLLYLIAYLVALVCFFSLLRRYKANTLWSTSWLQRGSLEVKEYFMREDSSRSSAYSYILFVGLNILFACAAVYLFFYLESAGCQLLFALLILCWAALDLACFRLTVVKAMQEDKINQAIANIASGDISYCVNLEEFSGKQKITADYINHIGENLDSALQEKVKSERFKADLITNVSHDLKTPLTSIINYVDLIKREQIQDEKIQGYLEVLEQKSQRLKTLTEDLVEASKASSGNLKLEISDIDFVELIHQTNGEFEEKFSTRFLVLVSRLPEEPILIEADGRRLWRVLENLYNNAFKYAMMNSRVYVDVGQEDDRVAFTIKNISENPLNISSSELTERFVRGDVSRTTEGSGLGLSIAQSLTQLQGGTFQILIDGDLFKVQVKFPVKKESDSRNSLKNVLE